MNPPQQSTSTPAVQPAMIFQERRGAAAGCTAVGWCQIGGGWSPDGG
ncbi:hypothetical protein AB0F81_26000 [Actinoplanes sp. NPDC024001]